jgi:hypothetical protein
MCAVVVGSHTLAKREGAGVRSSGMVDNATGYGAVADNWLDHQPNIFLSNLNHRFCSIWTALMFSSFDFHSTYVHEYTVHKSG